MADYISRHFSPELIICSPALRAKQTCLQVCDKSGRADDSVQWQADLYLASTHTLLITISEAMQKCDSLLMIGHNPGFDDLVDYLSANELPLTASGKLMTTSALAVIDIPRQQKSLSANCGKSMSLVRPADLQQL
jgi:phosphohistidine phosphatase